MDELATATGLGDEITPPSPVDRLTALEKRVDALMGLMADLIGSDSEHFAHHSRLNRSWEA